MVIFDRFERADQPGFPVLCCFCADSRHQHRLFYHSGRLRRSCMECWEGSAPAMDDEEYRRLREDKAAKRAANILKYGDG